MSLVCTKQRRFVCSMVSVCCATAMVVDVVVKNKSGKVSIKAKRLLSFYCVHSAQVYVSNLSDCRHRSASQLYGGDALCWLASGYTNCG